MDPHVRNRRLAARVGIGLGCTGLILALVALFLPFAGSAGAAQTKTSQAKTSPTKRDPDSPPDLAACEPANVITEFHFTINGKFASTLHNMVHEGDSVKAFFNIAKGCTDISVALVSHTLPDSTFVKAHVSEQKVFDAARGSFDAGMHTLGPIGVPMCFFQIDFAVFGHKGEGSHIFSVDVGGTTSCTPTAPTTTSTTAPPAHVLPTVITAPPAHVAAAVAVTPKAAAAVTPKAAVSPSMAVATTMPQVAAAQVTTLPKTGANTGRMLTLALGLMVAGGLLTFAAKRSLRPHTSGSRLSP
jgi:hypothetical protein